MKPLPSFLTLSRWCSGHIEYRRSCEICKGKWAAVSVTFSARALASWPFSLPSWLPQHSFQTGLQRTVDVHQLFSEDQWHFCKIHTMDVDWTVLQGSTERASPPWGPSEVSCWAALYFSDRGELHIPDLVIVAKSCQLGESTSPGLWPLRPVTIPNRTYSSTPSQECFSAGPFMSTRIEYQNSLQLQQRSAHLLLLSSHLSPGAPE